MIVFSFTWSATSVTASPLQICNFRDLAFEALGGDFRKVKMVTPKKIVALNCHAWTLEVSLSVTWSPMKPCTLLNFEAISDVVTILER